jgi:hypothetical protein
LFEFIRKNTPGAKISPFENKIDHEDARERSNGVVYHDGSAKPGENVRETFDRMTGLLSANNGVVQPGVELKAGKDEEKGCC